MLIGLMAFPFAYALGNIFIEAIKLILK